MRHVYKNPEFLIRWMVGLVFLSEGTQKFLFPESVGAGRFLNIGIPAPAVMAVIVGSTEIICGTLLLAHRWTRQATIPLFVVMLVAVMSTKIPIFLEGGFWKMAHESRTDFAMIMGLAFIFISSRKEK